MYNLVNFLCSRGNTFGCLSIFVKVENCTFCWFLEKESLYRSLDDFMKKIRDEINFFGRIERRKKKLKKRRRRFIRRRKNRK